MFRIETLSAETRDVSQGGFALHVPRELRTGEIIEIEVPKSDGWLFIAARVAFCRYVSVQKYMIGVKALESGSEPIISLSPTEAALTYHWLFEFLRTRAA